MIDDWTACRRMLAAGSKSFALATRLFPRTRRDRIAATYAWCRACDDRIDGVPAAEQPAALAGLRAELRAIYAGEAMGTPAARCFQAVVTACRIPERHAAELLDGFAMDVARTRYDTLADLERYAYRVAGTVGLMLCAVMDVRDRRAHPHAAALGIAMQLTNVCRDVAEDWSLGRVYVPAAFLDARTATLLRTPRGAFPDAARPAMARAVRRLLAEADARYRVADEGLRYLDRRSRIAVHLARRVYAAIGTEIARRGHDVLAARAVVPARTKLRLTFGAVAHGLGARAA
jgi:phytoene synthase